MSVRGLVEHCRRLWPRYTLLPALPFVGWAAYSFGIGERRWEIAALFFFGLMAYVGPRTKALYLGMAPAAFVAILYDLMRFTRHVGLSADRVHLCDVQRFEADWFGTYVNGFPRTVHDFIRPRTTLALDVFFSIPYALYLEAIVLFGVYLYLRDPIAMRRFTWGFLLLNVLGFVSHHVYPTAPPWYHHLHGCVVDMTTAGNEGASLARVDAWLGAPYFAGFYRRSQDVFGAIPSLHAAYPLLIALECWALGLRRLKIAATVFFVWMCVAAVYLDHHWIVDLIAGAAYGVAAFVALRYTPALASKPLPATPDAVYARNAGAHHRGPLP